LAPPEAEKAQQKAQAHLEWTRATSEKRQIEFIWKGKLDPFKQQIDTCKKDHDQKVKEIQAEVAEVERKARERISELTRARNTRLSELEAQREPLLAQLQAQLEPVQKQIKLNWDLECNLQESIRSKCPHLSNLTASELLESVPTEEHPQTRFKCQTCGAEVAPALVSQYISRNDGEGGRSDLAYANGNNGGWGLRPRSEVRRARNQLRDRVGRSTGQAPLRERGAGGRDDGEGGPSTPWDHPPRGKRSFIDLLNEEFDEDYRAGPSKRPKTPPRPRSPV
jgi:hypothetical protein